MSELKAGRELDAMVAERVFGWPPFAKKALNLLGEHQSISGDICFLCGRPAEPGKECLPHFSSSIAAAWEVVRHIRQTRGHGLLEGPIDRLGEQELAHRICLAALKAVGGEK